MSCPMPSPAPISPSPERVAEIFSCLEAAVRTETYSMSDLFTMLHEFADNPPIISAFLTHLRAIFGEADQDGTPLTPTDAVVEVYRRTFFDAEYAALTHTDYMTANEKMMEEFVTQFITSNTLMQSTMRTMKGQ